MMSYRSMFWSATRASVLGLGAFAAAQMPGTLPRVNACAYCSSGVCMAGMAGAQACISNGSGQCILVNPGSCASA
jgi:hypothetical protein